MRKISQSYVLDLFTTLKNANISLWIELLLIFLLKRSVGLILKMLRQRFVTQGSSLCVVSGDSKFVSLIGKTLWSIRKRKIFSVLYCSQGLNYPIQKNTLQEPYLGSLMRLLIQLKYKLENNKVFKWFCNQLVLPELSRFFMHA